MKTMLLNRRKEIAMDPFPRLLKQSLREIQELDRVNCSSKETTRHYVLNEIVTPALHYIASQQTADKFSIRIISKTETCLLIFKENKWDFYYLVYAPTQCELTSLTTCLEVTRSGRTPRRQYAYRGCVEVPCTPDDVYQDYSLLFSEHVTRDSDNQRCEPFGMWNTYR
jgi:hypothetical protein